MVQLYPFDFGATQNDTWQNVLRQASRSNSSSSLRDRAFLRQAIYGLTEASTLPRARGASGVGAEWYTCEGWHVEIVACAGKGGEGGGDREGHRSPFTLRAMAWPKMLRSPRFLVLPPPTHRDAPRQPKKPQVSVPQRHPTLPPLAPAAATAALASPKMRHPKGSGLARLVPTRRRHIDCPPG